MKSPQSLTSPKITVLYHLYYEDSYEKMCVELEPLLALNAVFLFNICSETPDKKFIQAILKNQFPGCYIIKSSNKGKDIGGKLALLELYITLGIECDYLLFLHDKKSLQALKSANWKSGLLKIITPDGIKKAMQVFKENKKCGIVATEEYIIKEVVEQGIFTGINGSILTKLITEYNLSPPSYSFVAGTMFWAKAHPVKHFFTKYPPLAIRQNLEDGNVLDNFAGKITHSWERLLSWIITTENYSIEGI